MKLEVGKRYTQRDGVVVGPLQRFGVDGAPFRWRDRTGSTWTETGRWDFGSASVFDLVAEYQEPMTATEAQQRALEAAARIQESAPGPQSAVAPAADQALDQERNENTTQFNAATMAGYSRPQVVTGVLARFPRAMKELAKISSAGCAKHGVPAGDMGYLNVPDAYPFYTDKVGRHLVDEVIEGAMQTDPQMPGCTHAGAAAWNALARLEVLLKASET